MKKQIDSRRKLITVLLMFTILLYLTACAGNPIDNGEIIMTLEVSSSAITDGGSILKDCTTDGANYSPDLHIGNIKAEAEYLAIIMKDTNNENIHWAIWNIPADYSTLPGGIGDEPVVLGDAYQGMNYKGGIGYTGPDPQINAGVTHTYRFTVYALDRKIDLPDSSSAAMLATRLAVGDLTLQLGELEGTYKGVE